MLGGRISPFVPSTLFDLAPTSHLALFCIVQLLLEYTDAPAVVLLIFFLIGLLWVKMGIGLLWVNGSVPFQGLK